MLSRVILVVLLILVNNLTYAENSIKLINKDGVMFLPDSDMAFIGIYKEYFDSGTLKSTSEYIEGLKNGETNTFTFT